MRIVIYGAVAEPKKSISFIEDIKIKIKRLVALNLDLHQIKSGELLHLDYKNYTSMHSRNIGDVAITEAISNDYSNTDRNIKIEYCNWGNLISLQELKSLTLNDWLIIGGSGYIQFTENGELPGRIESDLNEISKSKINTIIHGIGVNFPYNSSENLTITKNSESIIKKFLDCGKCISVRDKFSMNLLSRYTKKPITLAGDPALHIGRKYLQNQHTNQSKSVQISTLQIGLNFAFHGPTSNQLLNNNFFSYVSALKKLQKDTGCEFNYFVHYDTEIIFQKLLKKYGIPVRLVYGSVANLIRNYASLDLHIGNMLHSCILAHSVDVPTVALAYDVKHLGFFELFGLKENCLSAHHFSELALLERARLILSNPTITISTIKKKRQQLQIINDEFVFHAMNIMEFK